MKYFPKTTQYVTKSFQLSTWSYEQKLIFNVFEKMKYFHKGMKSFQIQVEMYLTVLYIVHHVWLLNFILYCYPLKCALFSVLIELIAID